MHHPVRCVAILMQLVSIILVSEVVETSTPAPFVDIVVVRNPVQVGGSLELLLTLDNPGEGFDARLEVCIIIDGSVFLIDSYEGHIPAGAGVIDIPIWSASSVPQCLPPTVCFLVPLFDSVTGELLAWDSEIVGINQAPATVELSAMREIAAEYIKGLESR